MCLEQQSDANHSPYAQLLSQCLRGAAPSGRGLSFVKKNPWAIALVFAGQFWTTEKPTLSWAGLCKSQRFNEPGNSAMGKYKTRSK